MTGDSELAAAALPLYGIDGAGRDEALDAGGWRAHWRPLADELDALGAAGLSERGELLRRLLRANGVTYNAYGEGPEHERPWQLDVVPLLIAADDWRRLAAGLVQRARLLDRLLADCYGPQRLLAEDALPPAAVSGHPGFLRPLHGVAVPGGRRLHCYAADLVRGTDGRWVVLADRTQAPAGAGYALENRVVLARALPEAYARLGVERVAGAFIALRRTLRALAPVHRDNPRIVLLSPGPRSPTWFEHAWLARYLGLSLVEGGDLTVRDDRVHLKSLTGLKPVDVILRRLDDDACDPLELRRDSLLGVAGLVQAVRAGTVAVANALGSGLAENGALLPLMPALCRRLLNEDLLLPSGEAWTGAALLARLDAGEALAVRPVAGGGRPAFTDALAGDARERLRARIAGDPDAWLGQRLLPLATAPAWHNGRLAPRTVALRAFCFADDDGWQVLPGGLCRYEPEPGEAAPGAASARSSRGHAAVSMQPGGGSKDCWVLATGPVEPVSLLPSPTAPLELKRGGIDLPSRVSDNLFWLGRYGERLDGTARLLRAAWQNLDQPGGPRLALAVVRQAGIGPPGELTPGELVARLVGDRAAAGSLADVLARLQDSAFALRDRISNDLWRTIIHLRGLLPRRGAALAATEIGELLDRVIQGASAIAGMGAENVTRGPAWRFLDLGRRIERAIATIDLLRATVAGDAADGELDAVLDIADSALTYRSRYLASLQAPAVLDLLLTDASNPRSLAFQLAAAAEHIAALPQEPERALPSRVEALAIGAHTWMRLIDPCKVCRRDERGERSELRHLLDHLGSDLVVLSDALAERYFSHAAASRR